MQAHRFLHNRKVGAAEMAEAVGLATGARCQGRDIAVIQDTSEVWVGGTAAKRRGFGPVGRGGATRGILAHAAIAVDARGAMLGLLDLQVWTRQGGKPESERNRPFAEKESSRWLKTAEAAAERLTGAGSISLVSDAESDIYELLALMPQGLDFIVRQARDRRLAGGGLIGQAIKRLKSAGTIERAIAAAPGRKARLAKLAVRFMRVNIRRPSGRPASLPEAVELSVLELKEMKPPKGKKPVRWLLLTSHPIKDLARAAEIADLYRGRFFIERYFHTLKTAGFDIEAARIEAPQAFIAFASMALIATATIMMLVKARDGAGGESIDACFTPDDQTLLAAVGKTLEGKTAKQQNPHSPDCLAFAAWVIARLGGWDGYYGKPGPKTMREGLERYHAIKLGAKIAARGAQ